MNPVIETLKHDLSSYGWTTEYQAYVLQHGMNVLNGSNVKQFWERLASQSYSCFPKKRWNEPFGSSHLASKTHPKFSQKELEFVLQLINVMGWIQDWNRHNVDEHLIDLQPLRQIILSYNFQQFRRLSYVTTRIVNVHIGNVLEAMIDLDENFASYHTLLWQEHDYLVN